jgi:lysine-N-methylase
MSVIGRSAAPEVAARRPRLGEHILARQHVRGSTAFVLLHDERRKTVDQIDHRTWLVLSVADGTRDLEGIRLAAQRLGAHATTASIRTLLEELAQRGMLLEGPPPHEPDRVSEVSVGPPAHRTVEVLEDFTLRCDGSGGCCRQYDTVVLTPEDAAKARAWVPKRQTGPIGVERLLLPLRGSARIPLQVVTLDAGACAYLDSDRRCAIHRAGGSAAKPAGCRMFPQRYCDDGTAVRQGVRFECACVFESIGRAGHEALPVANPARVGDIPKAAVIDTLATRIVVRDGVSVPRESLRSWTDGLLKLSEHEDFAVRLWKCADELDSAGLNPTGPSMSAAAVPAEGPAVWVDALHRAASTHLRRDAAWRASDDLVLVALRWLVATTSTVRRPQVWGEVMALEPTSQRREAFYVRATAFGYAWIDGRPLITNLRDRAVRLWVARAMPTFGAFMGDEASRRHPLALVEALMRGHGLERYTEQLVPNGS